MTKWCRETLRHLWTAKMQPALWLPSLRFAVICLSYHSGPTRKSQIIYGDFGAPKYKSLLPNLIPY